MTEDDAVRAPVEFRDSKLAGVNFAQRLIELIVVPYEEEAIVEHRGELWHEVHMRGAYDGIEKRPGRVRSNRDHDDRRLVGRALRFWPSRQEGLVAEVRISQTPLGDETLALADDDVLSPSVGFAARGRDQEFDRRSMTRRIRKAFVDHIAFVPDPAYVGAKVLGVRSAAQSPAEAALQPLVTPNLDEIVAFMQARKG